MKVVGGDAVSQYMVARNGAGGVPFETGIAAPERAMWSDARAAGLKLVPSITAGSDSRPRQEYPLPWGRRRLEGVAGGCNLDHSAVSGSGSPAEDFATESTSAGEFTSNAYVHFGA